MCNLAIHPRRDLSRTRCDSPEQLNIISRKKEEERERERERKKKKKRRKKHKKGRRRGERREVMAVVEWRR